MASMIATELGFENALGTAPDLAAAEAPWRARILRIRYWRGIILIFAAAYFLLPLYAALAVSFENDSNHPSFFAAQQLPHEAGFMTAFLLSLRLAGVTVVISMVMLIPTATYVHLKLPKMRRVLEFVTILPIVIPPIVVISGVLDAAPLWARSSQYLLAYLYVILAYPFIYRSLDASMSVIDLKTLVEASRSLGGRSISTLWRVVIPNLRAGIMAGLVLTLALVLGEFTMANLDGWETLPVWIFNFSQKDSHIETAAAMFSLVGTWLLITGVLFIDPSARRARKNRTS